MRWMGFVLGVAVFSVQMAVAAAEEKKSSTSERVLGGVISGLLGQPQQPGAAYTAQERERLASLLQGGEYVTSRQGEPVDLMVFGVPLTHVDHVYTARPVPPSRTFPE